MAYKIIKGWPGEHTLDYQFTVANGVTINPGDFFCVSSAGTAIAGTYASNGSDTTDLYFFCFDVDTITGKVMGLPGNIILELESGDYTTGSYSPATQVTIVANKIANVDTSTRVVGQVLNVNATTGTIQVYIKPN